MIDVPRLMRLAMLCLAAWLAAPAAAQELVLDDPLTAPYGPSQQRRGGGCGALSGSGAPPLGLALLLLALGRAGRRG